MSRPSKIFVSLHQLRHYCQTKISELVASQSLQKTYPVVQLKDYSTTKQMIMLFSNIQKSIIQHVYSKPPPFIKGTYITHDKILIQMIQNHFPVAKVFSQPALRRRVWTSTLPVQHQFRTMMSGTPSSSNGTATTFLSSGFTRSTITGVGRGPSFSRQFSTTKSPCITLFQNNAAANGGQTNVFSHVSSRIFSPAGTKMNQPDLSDKQPSKYNTTCNANAANEDDDKNDNYYNRIFAQKSYDKGMGELISSTEAPREELEHNKLCIRRGSQQQKRKHKINRRKLDAIIHHDDLYHENLPGNNKSKFHSSNGAQLKRPPDHNHVKKKDDLPLIKTPNHSSIYMLITLDVIQFQNNEVNESTQYIGTPYINSIEQIAFNYRLHINGILKLIDNLQCHDHFCVKFKQGQLRIYFPSTIVTKQQAINFLYDIQVLDHAYENQTLFKVLTEDQLATSDQHGDDYFSFDTSNEVVGPDYFRDLQLYLDHTDYLIDTSPAFRQH